MKPIVKKSTDMSEYGQEGFLCTTHIESCDNRARGKLYSLPCAWFRWGFMNLQVHGYRNYMMQKY